MESEHFEGKDNPFEEEILGPTAADDSHPFRTVAIATQQCVHGTLRPDRDLTMTSTHGPQAKSVADATKIRQ